MLASLSTEACSSSASVIQKEKLDHAMSLIVTFKVTIIKTTFVLYSIDAMGLHLYRKITILHPKCTSIQALCGLIKWHFCSDPVYSIIESFKMSRLLFLIIDTIDKSLFKLRNLFVKF